MTVTFAIIFAVAATLVISSIETSVITPAFAQGDNMTRGGNATEGNMTAGSDMAGSGMATPPMMTP